MSDQDVERRSITGEKLRLERLAELRVKNTRAMIDDALSVRPKTDEQWNRFAEGRERVLVNGVRKLIEGAKDVPEAMYVLSIVSSPPDPDR